MSTTRRCRTCREDLPLDYAHFGLRAEYADGWNTECRWCAAAKQRARRKPRNPEKRAHQNAKQRAARRLAELADLRALEALCDAATAREPAGDMQPHEAASGAALMPQVSGRTYLPGRIETLERELAALPESAVQAAKESRRRLAAEAETSRQTAATCRPSAGASSGAQRQAPNPLLDDLEDWQLNENQIE